MVETDYSILGKNGESYAITTTVLQGGTDTALAKFDAFAIELGLNPANSTSAILNGDDEVTYRAASTAFIPNTTLKFINGYSLSSEGALGFHYANPRTALQTYELVDVSRMFFTQDPPNLAFVFHPIGGDLESSGSKYVGNVNGYVLYVKYNNYTGVNAKAFSVAIKVTPDSITFYFQQLNTSAGQFPLYGVTYNADPNDMDTAFIEQTSLGNIFEGSTRTKITITNQGGGEPPSVPVVTYISIDKPKISDEAGMNQSIVTVQFDTDVTQYVARLNGSDYNTGTLVHTGGAVAANTDAQVVIDWNELTTEGSNQINVYGQNATGWTTT